MEIAKNIPDALAILPQWVCWGAKGKPRKMPFDPRTGTPAKAGNLKHGQTSRPLHRPWKPAALGVWALSSMQRAVSLASTLTLLA